jgi:hypothetical protein
MSRKRRVGVPIEIHAEAVYTREIHERFYNELFESGAYRIVDKSCNGQRFAVVHTNEIGCNDARRYDIVLEGTEKIKCSCGLYEHAGLLCRHNLKVTSVNGFKVLAATFLKYEIVDSGSESI